jgi:hypothetical protein
MPTILYRYIPVLMLILHKNLWAKADAYSPESCGLQRELAVFDFYLLS